MNSMEDFAPIENPEKLSYRELIVFWAIFLSTLVPRIYFFRGELWAWDSGEFAVAVENVMFPHAPYPGYIALGILFKNLLPFSLDYSLSVLSFISGTAAIFPFFYIARKVLRENTTALMATFLFAFAPTLINQSGYQEIYSTQCFFVLLALAILVSDHRYSFWLSALVYGFSIAVNIADIFLIPFFLCFMYFERWRFSRALAWFSLAFGVEFLAICWTFIEFGSLGKTFDYWFLGKELDAMAGSLGGGGQGGGTHAFVSGLRDMDWLINKWASLIKSMFFSLTPVLTIIGFLGFIVLYTREKKWAILLGIFALPYLIFDSTFPVELRAIGLYLTFFLPVMAIFGASFLGYWLTNPYKFKRLAPVSFSIILFSFQIFVSPSLPGPSSVEQYLYGIHGYFKWIKEVTPGNSLLITEREPWVVRFYSDRATVYSNFKFLDAWGQDKDENKEKKGLTLFSKNPKMLTANDHKKITLHEVSDEIREGVPVYATTRPPFKEFVPMDRVGRKGGEEILVADLHDAYTTTGSQKELVENVFVDDFSTNGHENESFHFENISRSGGANERSIHPSAYDQVATVVYRLDYPAEIKSMQIELKMTIEHPDHYIKLYVMGGDKEASLLYKFSKDSNKDVFEPEIDVSTMVNSSRTAFIKIELFVDDSDGSGLRRVRLNEIKVRASYESYPVSKMPLYRLSTMDLYLYDTFSSDKFKKQSVLSENILHDSKEGFIYPASYDNPAIIVYKIQSAEPLDSLLDTLKMEARFFVIGQGNFAEVYVSPDGENYKRIYQLRNNFHVGVDKPLLDITPSGRGSHEFFVRILLYRDGGTIGSLIDSRLEKIKIYGY